MKKYLIYLTRSAEVASRLFNSISAGKDGIEKVRCGAGASDLIPKIYLDEHYFYCVIIYAEDAEVEPYRLVIA